jgi:tripartite ATP-independent transporter DctM subunit
MIAVTFFGLLVMLALSVSIAASFGILGLSLSAIYSSFPLSNAMGEVFWSSSSSFLLVAIPFFILMGEILLRSGIAESMYRALSMWVSWLPGGLLHTNIAACAVFSSISGSSVATAATIGTVAVDELSARKYDTRLSLGSLAAGGTLGILIPPSINLIVYGALTETSIPQLYLAGFIPGFLLAATFMATIFIVCVLRPSLDGERPKTSWSERLRALTFLGPPLAIFVCVIGSIYAGIATPTESAAIGVVASLAFAAVNGRVSVRMLLDSFESTMKTTAMITLILGAATFLNFVLTSIGLNRAVADFMIGLGLSPLGTLLAVVALLLVLGLFLETLSMMVAVVPIVTPILVQMGYDPVWFGILVVVLVETAMVTPPVGVNLFVVNAARGGGDLTEVIAGVIPFVIALLLVVALLIIFPDIALWLPRVAG